jgi:fructokinase
MAAVPAAALRIFDINLRQNFYCRELIEESLRLANVLKLNDEELVKLAQLFEMPMGTRQQMEWLASQFGLNLVVLTRGPRGSLILTENGWSEQPGREVNVVDTVGAGDSFTAALAIGVLSKMEIGAAHTIASEVARYVCSQPGATPPLPQIFQNKFSNRSIANGSHQTPPSPSNFPADISDAKQTTL